jgi:hypothetical protein
MVGPLTPTQEQELRARGRLGARIKQAVHQVNEIARRRETDLQREACDFIDRHNLLAKIGLAWQGDLAHGEALLEQLHGYLPDLRHEAKNLLAQRRARVEVQGGV